MEEDIKILADLIFEIKKLGVDEEKAQAIENLIKRVKELEEVVNKYGATEELEQYILELSRLLGNVSIDAMVNTIKNNFIPKSKIREKIEETNNELEEKYSAEKISIFSGNTYMEKFKLLGQKYALQELLEDK